MTVGNAGGPTARGGDRDFAFWQEASIGQGRPEHTSDVFARLQHGTGWVVTRQAPVELG